MALILAPDTGTLGTGALLQAAIIALHGGQWERESLRWRRHGLWQQSHRSYKAPIQPDCSEQAETQTKTDSTGRAAKRRLHLKPAGRASGIIDACLQHLHTSSPSASHALAPTQQSLLALLFPLAVRFCVQYLRSSITGLVDFRKNPPSPCRHASQRAAFSFLGSSARRILV